MYSGPPEKRSLSFIDVGTMLTVEAQIAPKGTILAELAFHNSNLEENEAKEDFGAVLTERKWLSSISLEPGKPTLAGATQNEEIAEFLIVTANIQK